MRIWNLNPVTGEYLGQSIADDSPLEPGVYLIPAHATDVPPPEIGEHQAAVFRDGAALIVPDWRGHRYWLADGSSHIITELGVVPPAEALDEKPDIPAPPPRVVSRAQAMAALLHFGLLEDARAWVDSADNPLIKIGFENAQAFDRDGVFVPEFVVAKNLGEAEVDALFTYAGSVKF